MTTFRAIGVKPWLISALNQLGITKPTPVQTACVPQILAGRNLIASAETGTGKTAAFLLPILQSLAEDPFGICAVIITPTRELAFQISQQLTALGAQIAVRYHLLVGGVPELSQATALAARPHVVVATPGRLALMIERKFIDLSRVKFLVMDEADRLLDPTYITDLKATVDSCSSPKRQTLMFSATMTPSMDALQQLAGDADTTFRFDANDNTFATVDQLDQQYVFLPTNLKECHLVHFLKQLYPRHSTIIFVARCETAQLLLTMLNLLGMKKVVAMHSDLKQPERIAALQSFKSNSVRALIATDVASRGLDIPQCQLVINYDLPRSVSTYVHRVGRTARAGRTGLAVSLVTAEDVQLVHAIEEKIDQKLSRHSSSGDDDVLAHLSSTLKAKQVATLNLHDNGYMDMANTKRADLRSEAKKRRKERLKGRVEKLTRPQRS